MSTSDAAEPQLRVVGGETATPLHGAARPTRTTAREQQDATIGEKFKHKNHHSDETATQQLCHQAAIRQGETREELILTADRLKKEEASHCDGSNIQTEKPVGPRYSTCLLLRLSRNLGLEDPERGLEKKIESCVHSLTKIQRAEAKNSSCQVNGQRSLLDTSLKVISDSALSERIPAKKKEEVITVLHNELETTRDLSVTHSFSSGESGPHECNGLYIFPCGSQPRSTTRSVKLVEEENRKDHTLLEKQTSIVQLSHHPGTMLSSSVVTVLAPHWSSRLRRTKRFDGTGSTEAQGNLQDVTNTVATHAHERFQENVDRPLTDGSQTQLRVPFMGTRRNTVGWSTKSGPASLDYESKRKIIQTISLDVNSGRMDNSGRDSGALSPAASTPSPMSPLSLDPNEHRRIPETGHQGGLSSLSSKPTTSSLLLSLRRCNSNGRNSNPASTLSDTTPHHRNSSPSDRDGKLFTTHLSQSFLNNNEQEGAKPLLSPPSISYRPTETILSPSSSNHREGNKFQTRFFAPSPTNKEAEDRPFSQQPETINSPHSILSCSKQTFQSRGPSGRQQNHKGSDKSTNLLSESSVSLSRHSPYDRSALPKPNSLPRRTILTTTSWWKQGTQKGNSPQMLSDPTIIKDKPNTFLDLPCNNNRDMNSPNLTDNKRFCSQIPNNRDNNNTTESVHKGNMNLVMKEQGGTHSLKQRSAGDSPHHESDRLIKQQCGSNLKREPQKPHILPDVFSASKISRTTAQTTQSHIKDLTKLDISNGSFTASVTELPPTLLNAKSSDTPTESSSKYSNNLGASKTSSTPASPYNKDPQKFTKPSVSLVTTSTLSSQALASKTASGLLQTPNTNTSSSLHSHLVGSQSNILSSLHTNSSSQAPKFTDTVSTPLSFERSYGSVSKPFHPKTEFSLSPPRKTNYSSVSTASTSSSFTTCSHPAATVVLNPSLLASPVTSAIASSPTISSILTPPATPIITSPNYSDSSSTKEGGAFCQERDPKKLCPRQEGKRVRRVTWEDSVDLQSSEPIIAEKPEPSPVSTSSPTPSPRSIKAPSIFSFLRSSSPSTNASPLCSQSPKTSSIEVMKGGKYRSLSSDSADLASRCRERYDKRPSHTMIFDQGRQDLTTPRQERTLSVESGTVQCYSSTPLSLPPDFSSGYKLRYSSPPYSTLMSTRSTQGETKTVTARSPLFQQSSQSNYTPHHSLHTDQLAAMASKPPLSPIGLPQSITLPLKNKTAPRESSHCLVSEADQVNNNVRKKNNQDHHNGQILLVNNRVHVSSQSLDGDKTHNSVSTCVTETLVYSIKSKIDPATPKNTTLKPLQHTANTPVSVETKLSQQSHAVQRKEATGEPHSHSDQGSSGSSSAESHPPDNQSSNRKMRESVLSKSRFFSVESNSEQSPKRNRFRLKKTESTPNSSLSRSESDRPSKTNNKMDQVFNRLRQKFSTRWGDDDTSFPWKWKRASQTPSVSGSSDISNVSDTTVESTKTPEMREQKKEMVLKDNDKDTEGTNRWTQNRYTLIPPSPSVSTTGDTFYIWPDKSSPETDPDMQNTFGEHMSESKNQPHLTINSPIINQFDFYTDNEEEYKPSNHQKFLSCRDPSPGRSPSSSAAYTTQFRKSTPSPRSPFSPFSSLSPLSSFPSPDVTDDSVFYSPKLQRRRESPSPCEPAEGISLGSSRRSRASTGPPSAGPRQDKECSASSYADLKYGIEPGRSFSVSSVLSSRPSGPGRISTGSRFMSVGDLSESSLTCGGAGKDLDPGWSTEYDCQPIKDSRVSYFPSDPGKMRSRSLPRSLTRCLANWSSGESASPPVAITNSKPSCLWGPNMNTYHFAWDTEGPPTPPPTPPLSPVSRRMSKPPSLSPTFPSSSGVQQQVDSQSSRGHLPSRGYVSSLNTFEESSDSSSDTTTDDEYYLETGEDEEKETEL